MFLSPGVVRFLYWLDTYALIKNSEIEIIRNWLNPVENPKATLEVLNIEDAVEIKKSTFTNQKANLKDIPNTQCELVLESIGYVLRISNKQDQIT